MGWTRLRDAVVRHRAPLVLVGISVAAISSWLLLGVPRILNFTRSLFDAMPDIASILLVIVGLGALVPHLQDRIPITARVWVFVGLSIAGALGVVYSAMQRERDKREMFGVITGGDSFCYVEFLGGSEINADIQQVGLFDVPDVRISITDLDAFDAAAQRQDLFSAAESYRRSFPVIPLVSRMLFKPLTTYPIADYRRFNVLVVLRNGSVLETARVKRVTNGWATATVVTASFLNGKSGLVYQNVTPSFPKDLLNNDVEWSNLSRTKKLTVDKP